MRLVYSASIRPFDTTHLMIELVTWLREERQAGLLHPLVLIALWVIVFLEILPFQDGNGRLCRMLPQHALGPLKAKSSNRGLFHV